MIKNIFSILVILISTNTYASQIAPTKEYKYQNIPYDSLSSAQDAVISYHEGLGRELVKLVDLPIRYISKKYAYQYSVKWLQHYTASGGLGVFYHTDTSAMFNYMENNVAGCIIDREIEIIQDNAPNYFKFNVIETSLVGDSSVCHQNTETFETTRTEDLTLNYFSTSAAIYRTEKEDSQIPMECTSTNSSCKTASEKEKDGVFGNPIAIFTGNKAQQEIDYMSKYLNFVRYYNSEQEFTIKTLGNGWSHSYSDRLLLPKNNNLSYLSLPTFIQYVNDKSHIINFKSSGFNNYVATDQLNMSMTKIGSKIIMNDHGVIKKFNTSDGYLSSIDYSTHKIIINRSGDKINKISNNFGDEITFNYINNILESITLPNSNSVYFDRDSNWNLTKVTYPDTKSKTYHYEDLNFLGLLTGITDENGIRYATWTYDSNGKGLSSEHANGFESSSSNTARTTVTNSKGLSITYQRPWASASGEYKAGRIPKVANVNKNGNQTKSNYNPYNLGFKKDITAPNNLKVINTENYYYTPEYITKTEFKNNNSGLIEKTVYFNHVSYNIPSESTTLGNKVSKVTNNLYSIDLTFDDSMRTTSKTITDLTNHTVPYATNGRTRTVSYSHGANGLVKAIDGARTDVNDFTFIDYDGFGNVTQIKNALCHNLTSIDDYDSTLTENANCQKIQFGNYNADHQPQLMIDVNGINTVLTYDLRNRLKTSSVQYATGTLTTTYDYDGVGQLDKVTLPDGSWLDYDFNGARYLTKVTNSIGETIEFTHDTEGMITNRVIKSATGVITNQFNQVWTIDNKLEKFISGEGFETSYAYDVMDQVSSVTDHLTNIVSFERDLYSQITKEIDPLLGEVSRTYDQSGNVTSVTDQRGNTTTYTVDGFGQTIRLDSPDTGIEDYYQDSAGNITQKVTPLVTINYTFDILNRLETITYPDTTLNTTFTYDVGTNAKGKMSSVVYKHGSINLTYDGFGSLKDKTSLINGVLNTTTYNRDMYGRLDSMVYPSGMITNYTYDGLGRLDKITMQTSSGATEVTIVENIEYLPFGGIKSYDYGNGTSFSADFNLDYAVTNVSHSNGSTDLFSEDYGYRKLHQIDSITDNLNVLNNQAFTYDAKDQLVGANGVYGDYDYSYDSVGNRLSKTVDLLNVESYSIDATSNQLLDVTKGLDSRTFGYDNIGNVTTDTDFDGTVSLLDFSDNNRLTKATVAGVDFEYGYNPFGQRIIDNGKTNQFDQSGNLIHVQDGATTIEYIYIGQTKVAMIKDGVINYAHNNYMGLPRLYTDSSKNIVWSGEFKPFGELFNENGLLSNWVRFIGQWKNVETGYFYNYFRDYDPTLGRYLQSDPIGLNAGVNTYTYVTNNPINGVDPFGLYVSYDSNMTQDQISQISSLLEIIGSIEPHVKSLIDKLKNHHKKITITMDNSKDTQVDNVDDCNITLNFNMNDILNWSKRSGFTLLNVTAHELQHAADFADNVKSIKYNPFQEFMSGYPNSLEQRGDITMNNFVKNANKLGWDLSERNRYGQSF